MHRHISQRQSSMSAANQRQGRVRTTSAVSACPLLAKGLRQKCEPLSAPRARFASLLERGSTRWALGTAEGGVRKAPVGQIWSALPASGRPVVLLRLTLCLSRGTPRASERSPKGLSDKGRGTQCRQGRSSPQGASGTSAQAWAQRRHLWRQRRINCALPPSRGAGGRGLTRARGTTSFGVGLGESGSGAGGPAG